MKRLLTLALGSAMAVFLATPASADTFIDLETSGSGGTAGGAFYLQGETGPSGTGIFPAFSRVQANNQEEGLSTTANILDNTSDNTHNFSILKSDLGVVTCSAAQALANQCVAGTQYYEFHLDINEAGGGDEFLLLDDLEIWYSSVQNSTTYPVDGGTRVYDLSALNVSILMDYSLEAGSGKADMTVLIPISLLAGASSTQWIYLYSSFGHLTSCPALGDNSTEDAKCTAGVDYHSSDGFEEWNFNATQGGTFVPDGGSTLGLLGLGMMTLGYVRRRFSKN